MIPNAVHHNLLRMLGGKEGGQALFAGVGSYSFVVPAGVTSICAVAIGMGGPWFSDGSNNGSGGGGALSYRNAIAVTPGELLSIVISQTVADPYEEGASLLRRGGSTLVGGGAGRVPAAGSPYSVSGAIGYAGGQGAYEFFGSGTMEGAGAGGYTSAGQASNGVRPQRGGGGTPANGGGAGANAGASANLNGMNYGGGAAWGGQPGAGAVRIIWGAGRAFPDTNTGDI